MTLFQGRSVPVNQIHDLHPPISPSGLYWVVPVPKADLEISADGRNATLTMTNLAIIDQPRFPAIDARATPAVMSFRLIWRATDEKIVYDNPMQHYRVEGFKAIAQLEAQIHVPSTGYSWKSDPLSESFAAYAIIGQEVNGRYYDQKR